MQPSQLAKTVDVGSMWRHRFTKCACAAYRSARSASVQQFLFATIIGSRNVRYHSSMRCAWRACRSTWSASGQPPQLARR
eukprot:12004560-Karenia_brevis.AAC.1